MMNNPPVSESNESCNAARSGLNWMILALLLAFPSTGVFQKYTGLMGVAGYVASVCVVCYSIWIFGYRMAPMLRRYFHGLSLLVLAGLAIIFVFIYPIENSKGLGHSSDRDDGLNLAVARMADGQSPYYPTDKFAGPLSVLPGGIVLSAPFVALGNSAYQNLFWLTAFLFAACWMFRDRALALVILSVPLALSPAAQYEYISGGDLIANGIYVALFFLLALKLWTNPKASAWLRWLSCVLLGLGLASRPNFLLLLPLLGAVLWRTVGFRQALASSGFVALVSASITVLIYLYDPAGFTPFHAKQKLSIVDHALPWAGHAIIWASALAGVIGAFALLLLPSTDLTRSFFRWCTLVTLCPMVCIVALSSVIHQRLDFTFMHDRFGLMYVFFALFGWGGSMLGDSESRVVAAETEPQS